MQNNIIGDIKVTPSEVKKYYADLPKDSLPFIEAEYEVRQIMLKPPYTEDAILDVRQRLLDMRKQILEGKTTFAVLAALYSEDKESAVNGGELGMKSKGDFVAAFADAAFKLKEGQLSNIVQTEYGYHIIQLIAKDEDRVNVRHILLRPKITPQVRNKALFRLDSIANLIRIDSITYEKAALIYSQDDDTRANGGLMVNPKTSNAKFKLNDFNKTDYFVIKDLKVGEISKPYESLDDKGNTIYKIVTIILKTSPHNANLKDDYDVIQEMTKSNRQQQIIKEWIEDKQKKTYIHIDKSFANCDFESKGWIK